MTQVRWIFESRRGAGIAAVVLLLVLVNVAIVGSVAASGDEAETGLLRVEAARAFYAAEGGAVVVLKQLRTAGDLPGEGSTRGIGAGEVVYLEVPEKPGEHEIVLEGRAGHSVRRVRITLESQ